MNEDRVQSRLRELRESMAALEAPESVETAALAAFRVHVAARPSRRLSPAWRWAAAACLALAASFAAWQTMRPARTEIATVPVPKPAVRLPAIEPMPEPEAAVAATAVALGSRKPVRVTRRRAVEKPQAPPETDSAAMFVPLPFAPPLAPSEDRQVVRVRVPRGAMRQFGVMLREDGPREAVQADFLLGQDGVARAVRLVNNTQ